VRRSGCGGSNRDLRSCAEYNFNALDIRALRASPMEPVLGGRHQNQRPLTGIHSGDECRSAQRGARDVVAILGILVACWCFRVLMSSLAAFQEMCLFEALTFSAFYKFCFALLAINVRGRNFFIDRRRVSYMGLIGAINVCGKLSSGRPSPSVAVFRALRSGQ